VVIRAQLARILESRPLEKSERLRSLLRFVVEESLAGRSASLKEYTIATAVFRRTVSYDPKTDALVRVEAGRLRRKLEEYYTGPGSADRVVIQLPKGTYVPEAVWRDPPRSKSPRFRVWWGLLLVSLVWGSWLTARELRRMWHRHGEQFAGDVVARDLYWSGVYLRGRGQMAELAQGARLLEQARGRQPGNAKVRAALAASYAELAVGPVEGWQEYARRVRENAALAERLDPELAEGWQARGLVAMLRGRNWSEADRCFERAARAERGYAPVYLMTALGMAARGRTVEALAKLEHGCALDPTACLVRMEAAEILYYCRRYGEARWRAMTTAGLRPGWSRPSLVVGMCEAAEGRLGAAAEWFAKASGTERRDPEAEARLANVLGRLGRGAEVAERTAALEARARTETVRRSWRAWAYLGAGDRERVLALLKESLEAREPEAIWLATDAVYAPLRGDGRFAALLAKAGVGR
jgi:tetratricopeptide (TPR) repeat protein